MDLEGTMLSEISKRKTNTICGTKTRKESSKIQRTDWWLPEVGGFAGRR